MPRLSNDICPLPDPDVGLSICGCDVEHTSFHFGLCGRKFVLCLFGQCPGICTILCHSWQHTGVVHLSLQADGKVDFEDVPVFGVCRPACHDSSVCIYSSLLRLRNYVVQTNRQMRVFLYAFCKPRPLSRMEGGGGGVIIMRVVAKAI